MADVTGFHAKQRHCSYSIAWRVDRLCFVSSVARTSRTPDISMESCHFQVGHGGLKWSHRYYFDWTIKGAAGSERVCMSKMLHEFGKAKKVGGRADGGTRTVAAGDFGMLLAVLVTSPMSV